MKIYDEISPLYVAEREEKRKRHRRDRERERC